MKDLSGIKVAILVVEGCECSPIFGIKRAFETESVQTELVTLDGSEQIRSVEEGQCVPSLSVDKPLTQVQEANYAALVIPEGVDLDTLRDRDKVLNFVRLFVDHEKPIYCIENGSLILSSAGVIRGRRVPSTDGNRNTLEEMGACSVDCSTVVDGDLVTHSVKRYLGDFPKTVVAHLKMNLAV